MAQKLVLLVHGIRTHAKWQDVATTILSEIPNCDVRSIGYGYFDVLRFWFPFLTRNKPIATVKNQILGILAQFPSDTEVTIIAHSFGTYTVTRILEETSFLKIENLVLCGAIVSQDYDWARADNQVNGKIVNECGSRDVWPPFAKAASWFYGAIGTYGAKKFQVIDRKHPFGHSDYFSKDFIKQYWKPIVESGEIKNAEYPGEKTNNPAWFYFFEFPWKWALVALLVFAINAFFPGIQHSAVMQSHDLISSHPALLAAHLPTQRKGCQRPTIQITGQFCATPNERLRNVDQGGEGLVIRSGPSTVCAGVLGRDIFPGEKVEVLEVARKWYYVRKKNLDGQASPTEGWAHRSYLNQTPC